MEQNNKSRFLCFGESEPHYFQFMTGDVVRLVNELNEFGGIVMADNGKVLIDTFSGIGIDCGSYSALLSTYIDEVSYIECHKFDLPSPQMVIIDGHPFLASNESIAFQDVKKAVIQVKVNELAEKLDEFAQDYDLYEYRDSVDDSVSNIQSLKNDIETGNTKEIFEFLHTVIEECDSDNQEYADRAAVLVQKLKDINEPVNSIEIEHTHMGSEVSLSYAEIEAIASDSLVVEVNPEKEYENINKLKEESALMSRFLGEKLMRPHKKGR